MMKLLKLAIPILVAGFAAQPQPAAALMDMDNLFGGGDDDGLGGLMDNLFGGGDSSNDDGLGGLMGGIGEMMDGILGDGGFGCMMQCSMGMINKPSFQLYMNSCFNFDFTATSMDFGTSFCEPACRRALFDYFTDYYDCWGDCPSNGIFDPSQMEAQSAAQMAAFSSCGGVTGAAGFSFRVSWSFSFTSGDPHFTTLDGQDYTFNGLGDFWLVRDDKDNGVEIQVRTDKCGADDGATCITAVAIATGVEGVNRETVVVTKNANQLATFVSGAPTSQSQSLGSAADSLTIKSSNSVAVEAINGVKIDVWLKESIGVGVGVMSDLKSRVVGLYGNFDGDASNDFIGSDGTIYGASSTDAELFAFGESWRVAASDSLLRTTLGSPPDHVGWMPKFAKDVDIPTEVTEKCEAAGLTGTALSNCKFDVAVTKNDKFVEESKEAANFMVVKQTQDAGEQTITSSQQIGQTDAGTAAIDAGASRLAIHFMAAIAAATAPLFLV